MIVKRNQVFYLLAENYCSDNVLASLQTYLSILNEIQTEKHWNWDCVPKSAAQFEFYKQAVESSPDVFKKHGNYDSFITELDKKENWKFKNALETNHFSEIKKESGKYKNLLEFIDLGIEDRARHYTSNLVKIGFADEKRNISESGKTLLYPAMIEKDELEKILPLDSANIVYLRQLLKLKIFDSAKENFYAPFILAIYILLKKERFSENEFLEIIQGFSPYSKIDDIENYIDSYKEGDVVDSFESEIPAELKNDYKLEKSVFSKYFKNQKSSTTTDIYFTFYSLLFDFSKTVSEQSFEKLLAYYKSEKDILKKAFGKGKEIFKIKDKNISANDFKNQNPQIFSGDLNKNLYAIFYKSKQLDAIREYSDTTKRIFKATGLVSFENGYAELAFKDICNCIFDIDDLKRNFIGKIENQTVCESYDKYEIGMESYFCSVKTVSEILNYDGQKISQKINQIKTIYNERDIENILDIVAEKRNEEFKKFIFEKYPVQKVKDILALFADRTNDNKIKEAVNPDANVPTIFEYIVGIAWFYFSGCRINLLKSFNLALSANFEPLMHAGGGHGDIVIYEKDKVVMLEVTLMNANSQKRGEWEPVLRHSANLKIEEESNGLKRDVTTFFIADEFDYNTINIWKAVSSVSLQSSNDKSKFTSNVIIMPVSTGELSVLIGKADKYDEIIGSVRTLFENSRIDFDINWRKKFISQII